MYFDAMKLALARRLLSPGMSNLFAARFRRHEQELLYQGVFSGACSALGLNQAFFPVKGAANHSLLYLLMRISLETDVKRVLELGAGQSSLLFNQLRKHRNFEVVTLEHNEEWARRIGSLVSHQVIYAPLLERTIEGFRSPAYDLSQLSGKFDFVVVDGPVGSPSRSRWGALPLLSEHIEQEYVVVFDDAERKGEQQTIKEAIRILSASAKYPHVAITNALKSQVILASDRYGYVRFF